MEESPATQPQKPTVYERLATLRKRLVFYRIFSVFLLLFIAAMIFANRRLIKTGVLEIEKPFISYDKTAPYSKEIKKIIAPLRYSGLSDLMSPDVHISLDFKKRLWRLHNIHRFDKDGKTILQEGRYGLCGELAAYTYEKIHPLLNKGYLIEFVRAAESGYFLGPHASHIILRITGRFPLTNEIYILDPSFSRYGRIEQFEDYLFFEKTKGLAFVDEQDTDTVFLIDNSTPILIRKQLLIGLVVGENAGIFDKDNFILAITVTRRHKYAGRYIFALRRNKGHREMIEDMGLAKQLLKPGEYTQLRERLIELFEKIIA